ncbi:transposase [Paenibacillus thermoaerophilus]|uniref:Transposase n=1 Tax=Paenibacillus thermoaerophilus TaxID=1215385 RepID=A0ABW2UWZ6_9BACL|nr:transposase [Paenibacillus thermoaerophilus]
MFEQVHSLAEFASFCECESRCADALFRFKWPDGYRCPNCSHHEYYEITTRRLPLYECRRCRCQTSLTTGTIMEGSRTPLRKWFIAMFLFLCPGGVSAVRLADTIKVTYKTAWHMLHKIRHAATLADDGHQLSGLVRICGGMYGTNYRRYTVHHPEETPVLVGCSEQKSGDPSYLKIKLVPSAHVARGYRVKPSGVIRFIVDHVHLCSSIDCTTLSYARNPQFADLKRLLREARDTLCHTYGGLRRKHLQAYLNEFACRFNINGRGDSPFTVLATYCARAYPLTYARLIARNDAVLTGHFLTVAA